MLRKIRGEVCQNRLVACVQRSGVSDQHRTMELGAARDHRGRKRDAEAGSLISKEIRQAGSLVVLVFWQEGIGELADGNEEWRDTQALNRASKRLMLIVGAEIETRVIPHAQSKNAIAH